TEPPPAEPYAPETGLPPVPPVAAALALFFALSLTNATAASFTPHSPDSGISSASIVSANYSGTINDRVALLDAALQFCSAEEGQTVRLFGDDVAVQEFTVRDGRAELVREGKDIAVKFDRRGRAKLEIKILVKIAGDVTKHRLTFGIPPALSSQINFTLDEPEADVDFPTAISFKRILEIDQTRVEAVLGSADHIGLLWTPRVKRAEEVAATVFCQNASLVTFGNGVVNVRATLSYQITQGELRQARVRLPESQRLLRVEGKEIRAWEINDSASGQTLVVNLLKGVSSNWRLTVETEKLLDVLPANESVAVPHALDVKRETGLIALRSAEELGLSVESKSGLQRIEAGEFARATAGKADGLFSVFQ
ncbi:MAG TPA: hypothetical protein VKA67_12575, partial [Verrucomicrobiae bacterium]|nr:hypothetical protein [Verrucomicrobiae bacterium]